MKPNQDIRLLTVGFLVLAILLRLVPHDYNVSAIGALGMFVGCFWSARVGILVSLLGMLVSEILGELFSVPSMGFYSPWLMLTVYAAIASSALVGRYLVGWRTSQPKSKYMIPLWAGVPLGAFASAALFFLVTNFASWLDPQMMYPRTLMGLLECYWLALPFAGNTLVGNLFYSAIFFGSYVTLIAPHTSVDAR